MNEYCNPQVGGESDALSGSAAVWTASGEHGRPRWMVAPVGSMVAIGLSDRSVAPVAISSSDAVATIVRLVGDPSVTRINHLRRVQLWIGGRSASTSSVNGLASWALLRLLGDVRDGAYIASDAERRHARRRMRARRNVPVIYGDCLVTGVGADGGPSPLDENFVSWLSGVLDWPHPLRRPEFEDVDWLD